MVSLQKFISEDLPTLLIGSLGGGGVLVLIQYFFPGFKHKIENQRDIISYVNIELKKTNKKIECQAEKIESQAKEIESQAKEILEIKFKYQLSQEKMEDLKEYISKNPESISFLNKIEEKYYEKEMFLNKIKNVTPNEKSLTKKDIVVIFLLTLFFVLSFILIAYLYTINRASSSSNLKYEKEILELKSQNEILELKNNK